MANEIRSIEVQGNDYSLKPDLTFDTTPTIGSNNPVTSNGIALAVQAAAIGTDISVGRTDGSPVGYCSVSYGTNNIAAADHAIVFGVDNVSASEDTMVSGRNNNTYGSGKNAIFGNSNDTNSTYSVLGGFENILQVSITELTDNIHPDLRDNQVYIGYVDPSNLKIYVDPSHTQEVEIATDLNQYTHYFVDKTNSGNQQVGDVYLYTHTPNGNSLTKIVERYYVDFTDYCHCSAFSYCGTSYYLAANDTNYTDSSMTTEIPTNDLVYNVSLFFDMNDGSFILYNKGTNMGGSAPKWIRMTTYKGHPVHGGGRAASNYWGHKAYVSTAYDATDRWDVYTNSDHTPMSNITDRLQDGEYIGDIESGNVYKYTFDSYHHLVNVESIANCNSTIVMGSGNNVNKSNASIICGRDNSVPMQSEGSGIIGSGNSVTTGRINDNSGDGNFFVGGRNNNVRFISAGSGSVGSVTVLGKENIVHAENENIESMTVIGASNNLDGRATDFSQIYGYSNDVSETTNTVINGNENTVKFAQYANIVGNGNEVNAYILTGSPMGSPSALAVKDAIWQPNGTLLIDGTYYDNFINPGSAMRMPTYEVFVVKGRGSPKQYDDENDILYYAYSTNGVSLTYLNNPYEPVANILGNYNIYRRTIDSFFSSSSPASNNFDNYIIGAHNKMYVANSQGIGLIGYNLSYGGSAGAPAVVGEIITGAYNVYQGAGYSSAGKAQYIVGIGTSDNNRKDGFVVTTSGTLLAPSCSDSISEATSGSAIAYDANKAVVTYGMLQDYAPMTPGAIGKPIQTIVTLVSSNWSGNEITVPVTNMTSSCVVIIQPDGDPSGFYTDKIYLKTQGTDELTFGCGVTPSVDIPVKVVYWT